MSALNDCHGQKVRLTSERLAHILEHGEMKGMELEIAKVLNNPRMVRRSRTDGAGRFSGEHTRHRV